MDGGTETTTTRRNLGREFRCLRLKANLSQEALAAKADISPNFLGYLERGEKGASLEVMERLADALNVPLWLILKNASNGEGAVNGDSIAAVDKALSTCRSISVLVRQLNQELQYCRRQAPVILREKHRP